MPRDGSKETQVGGRRGKQRRLLSEDTGSLPTGVRHLGRTLDLFAPSQETIRKTRRRSVTDSPHPPGFETRKWTSTSLKLPIKSEMSKDVLVRLGPRRYSVWERTEPGEGLGQRRWGMRRLSCRNYLVNIDLGPHSQTNSLLD